MEVLGMDTCKLCSGLASPDNREPWNRPIFQTENFVTIPSLGALLEGWLLVVPKRHHLSMGALPPSLVPEMDALKQSAADHLSRIYGPVTAFEHGPAATGRKVGCGVDHAHLHLVPLGFNLLAASKNLMPDCASWKVANWLDCQSAYLAGLDYLYVEQPIGGARIATHGNFGSQVLRQAIAAQLGIPEQFNWRLHPQTHIVNSTIGTLGNANDARP
jgi:diadenosine tetraphosphate (Ap4A) HIT family hydrolase